MNLLSKLHFPNTIFYGEKSIQKLGEAARMLEVQELFVILSKRAEKEVEEIRKVASENHLTLHFFSEYSGEPTTEHLHHAIQQFKVSESKGVVGLGGGSPIDLAKAVSVLAKNEHMSIKNLHTKDYIERYPLIAIPTTAGTGSEVTKISVITDSETSVKYNPAHPSLVPDIAILDPQLTMNLPETVTAQTGMDALAHAMEAYVSTKATPLSDVFAKEAMRLISQNLRKAFYDPMNSEAREGMLRASSLAGMAFSNASTNLAHATARPLGVHFNLPHGLSVALTLAPVIEFGNLEAKQRYNEVATALETDDVLKYVNEINEYLGIHQQAKEMMDATELLKAIPKLTEDALSGNGIQTNIKLPTEKDAQTVYEKIAKQLSEG